MVKRLIICFVLCTCTMSCKNSDSDAIFYNPIMDSGHNADAIFYNGYYYYTHETSKGIRLWKTADITALRDAEYSDIRIPDPSDYISNIWNIDIRRINGRWYIYYAADNGHSDNHQIFVLECQGDDPLHDEYVQKGPIVTNPEWNWALHPSVFTFKDSLYMTWSGWSARRINWETQCIFIARMSNPWTLDTERVLISRPELEWERQWINPNGGRTAYPIFVNEAPQFFCSQDGNTAVIFYSASGCWTPYYCIGMLTNSSGNLLNSSDWKKAPEPVFSQDPEAQVLGPGSPCFIPSPDGTQWYMIYHARTVENSNTRYEETTSPSPRMQPIFWDKNGLPLLGSPIPVDQPIRKPSGTISAP